MPVPVSAAFNISSQTEDCWVFTSLCFLPREIDFVKKEEELKKVVDEKDKWYKQQLENLEHKVRKKNMLELASGVLKTEVAVPFCVHRWRCWSPEYLQKSSLIKTC